VIGKLAVRLPLVVMSAYLCELVIEELLGPQVWGRCFYLGYLVPFILVVLWCAALMPGETRARVAAAKRSFKISPFLALGVLSASAVILVSCADLAFERGILKNNRILPNAWVTNILLLFSAYVLMFAVSRRVTMALLLVSPFYVALCLATLAKIKFMHSAVQPLDLIRIPEFLPLFRSFFGAGVLVATVSAFGMWLGAVVAVQQRVEPCRMTARRRWVISASSLATLLGILVAVSVPLTPPQMAPVGAQGRVARMAEALPRVLGAPDGEHQEKARNSGILLAFISELPASFVSPPPNYSPAVVTGTMRKYWSAGDTVRMGSCRGGVNLIIYLVESFMDPSHLGVRFTSDPIPNIRALRSTSITGYAITPERFGGSANTEFEVLTGMTRSFLPEGSLPYRQYLRHALPSLPLTLRSLGYATLAVQADPNYYYDRERVYPLLGFDKVLWLYGAPEVERAARGPWPSDKAMVENVIRESQGAHPFFTFVFPSSTHAPYNFGVYRSSDLEVDGPASIDSLGELKEYVNALRGADSAFGKLVEYFRHQPDSTIIALLGDHLPPLSEDALRTFHANLAGKSRVEQERIVHRVPLLVWANFGLPPEEVELSANALPSYLLSKMGVPRAGFLAVTDTVRLRIPVLASYAQTADGRMWDRDSLPAAERAVVEDYRLLQYDLLLGKRYSGSGSNAAWATKGTVPEPPNGSSTAGRCRGRLSLHPPG
jgi:Sulfatase